MSVPTVNEVLAFAQNDFKEAFELLPQMGEIPTKTMSPSDREAVYSPRYRGNKQPSIVDVQLIIGTAIYGGEKRALSICLFQSESRQNKSLTAIAIINGRRIDWQIFEKLPQVTLRYPFWCVQNDPTLLSTLATYYLLPHIESNDYVFRESFWPNFRSACERIQDRRGKHVKDGIGRSSQSVHRSSITTHNTPPAQCHARRGRTPDPDDIAYMAQAYKKLKTEQADLQSNLQSDKDTIVNLRKQLDDAIKTAKDASLEKDRLGREIMELNKLKSAGQQLQEAQQTIQSLSAMNQELEQEKSKLRTQVDDLEEEIKNSKSKFMKWRINVAKAVEADAD